MASTFGRTSTTEDVLSGINLRGKRILVTGVSAGLGVETARSLVAHGAQVVGAARDLDKARTATAQVRKDAEENGGSFELVALDLSDLKSVRACADGLLAKGKQIFVERCARCHNENGDKSLKTGAPLSQRGLSTEAIAQAVNGRLRDGTEVERRAVTLYISSLMHKN